MKKFFEFRCENCNEEYEDYIEYKDIANIELTEKCSICGGPLKRVFTFGYGKFNGSGFTKGSTN